MKTEQMIGKQLTKARFSGVKIPVAPEEYPLMAKTYAEGLEKYPAMRIKTAIDKLLESVSTFPSISEIINEMKRTEIRVGADDITRNALPAGKGITFTEYLWDNPESYKQYWCSSPIMRKERKAFLEGILQKGGKDPHTGFIRKKDDIEFELGLINEVEVRKE